MHIENVQELFLIFIFHETNLDQRRVIYRGENEEGLMHKGILCALWELSWNLWQIIYHKKLFITLIRIVALN